MVVRKMFREICERLGWSLKIMRQGVQLLAKLRLPRRAVIAITYERINNLTKKVLF